MFNLPAPVHPKEIIPTYRRVDPAPVAGPSRVHVQAGDLRICMVISSFWPVVGGAERITERISRALSAQGVRVVVLTRRYPGSSPSDALGGVQVKRLGVGIHNKLGALTFGLHALWVLARGLRDFRIVHAQTPHTPLLVAIAAKVLLRRRFFTTIHTDPALHYGRRIGSGMRLGILRYAADCITVQNVAMMEELAALGVPRNRLHVLPNAVEVDVFRPPAEARKRAARVELAIPPEAHVFLFLGRLVPLKGVDVLLRAWAKRCVTDRHRILLIVGDGPERQSLQRLAGDLGLTNVRFYARTNDVPTFLAVSDVFVLPSRREGLSVALLEAMASGLAVLVSDLPANCEVVSDGLNGLTFPVDQIEHLERQLEMLTSQALRERLARSAVEYIRERHSLDVTVAEQRSLYEQALQ